MTEVLEQEADPDNKIDDKQIQIRRLYNKKVEQAQKQADFMFKVLSCSVVLGSTICFLNFFTFRQYCQSRDIYIISPLSLIWVVVGYFFMHYTRKWFKQFGEKRFPQYMHPRNAYYPLENQQKKIRNITKQTYDIIFHTTTTIVILVLCRQEPWFPMCSGGWGSCDAIFANYPNWPETLNPAIQIFYLCQLGFNIYLLLELLIFKRKELKLNSYYQMVFHHFITVILILFSIGYNFVPIGIMVMFVHDSSDAARAMGRVMSQSKYSVSHLTLSKVVDFVYLGTWAYMRTIVLPFCLIVSMYQNIPNETKDYNFVSLQHIYLMALSCGIYFLHSFWVFFLYKGSANERMGNAQFKKWLQEQKMKNQSSDAATELKKE